MMILKKYEFILNYFLLIISTHTRTTSLRRERYINTTYSHFNFASHDYASNRTIYLTPL